MSASIRIFCKDHTGFSNLTFCPVIRKLKCYLSCLITSTVSMAKPM